MGVCLLLTPTITPNLVLFYLALMYHKLLYCHDEAYQLLLCKFYSDIINSLTDAPDVIPTKIHNTFPKHTVPGWNDLVRDSHQTARESSSSGGLLGAPDTGLCMI